MHHLALEVSGLSGPAPEATDLAYSTRLMVPASAWAFAWQCAGGSRAHPDLRVHALHSDSPDATTRATAGASRTALVVTLIGERPTQEAGCS
jgi:hypothetical protein